MNKDSAQTKIEILDKVLNKGFAGLPRAVLRAKGLSRNAKCLYALLLDYAWQKGSCFPGQTRLCEDLGISENTLRKDLNELKEWKLVDWSQRGFTRTNIYYILPLENSQVMHTPSKIEVHEPQETAGHEAQDSESHETQKPADIIKEDNKPSVNKRSVKWVNANFKILTPQTLAQKYNDTKNLNFYIHLFKQIESGTYSPDDLRRAIQFTDEQNANRKAKGYEPLGNPAAFMVKSLNEHKVSRVRRERSLAETQKLINSI